MAFGNIEQRTRSILAKCRWFRNHGVCRKCLGHYTTKDVWIVYDEAGCIVGHANACPRILSRELKIIGVRGNLFSSVEIKSMRNYTAVHYSQRRNSDLETALQREEFQVK